MDSKNLSLEDIAFIIDQATEYGISLQNVLISYHNISQRTGLTTDKIQKLLPLMTKLEDHNVSPECLDKLLLAYMLWPGNKKIFLGKLQEMVRQANKTADSASRDNQNIL